LAWTVRILVRATKKCFSVSSRTLAGSSERVKLGQPVPDLNLSSELNKGSPETTST